MTVAAQPLEEELSLEDALQGFEEEEASPAVMDLEDEVLSIEGALEGFDEDLPVVEELASIEKSAPESEWSLRGHWLNALSWNTAHSAPSAASRPDYRGLSKLSTKLWLEAEVPLDQGWRLHGESYFRHDFAYSLNGSGDYPQTVLDRYQQDLEIGEFWLRGSLNQDLDLKVGRQIVVWGQSDYLRVNDTINPMDQREPGLGEIETLRLPLGMARADYYLGPWSLTALMIPEQRPSLTATCGSDFSVPGGLSESECSALAVPEQFPEDSLNRAEWGFSAMGRFSGWDLSLYGARLNSNTPYKDLSRNQLRYARINQLGAALNVAQGSWLWKGEIAWLDGLEYAQAVDRQRLDLLLGGEYRGFRDITLSLETVMREIDDYLPVLFDAPDYQQQRSWQTVFAYQHDLNNDTLHLKGVVLRNGDSLDEGGYSRLSVEYDLDDHWSVSGGGIWYQSALLPPDWGENDRLFIEARQNF